MRSVLKKLTAGEKPLPQASGENVFSAKEYAEAAGLGNSAARERIRRMVTSGKVRKVRTLRNGMLVQAFEWVGE